MNDKACIRGHLHCAPCAAARDAEVQEIQNRLAEIGRRMHEEYERVRHCGVYYPRLKVDPAAAEDFTVASVRDPHGRLAVWHPPSMRADEIHMSNQGRFDDPIAHDRCAVCGRYHIKPRGAR